VAVVRGRTAGALGAIAVALVVVAAAGAAAAPRTGAYRVTHGFRFAFSVKTAVCATPPKNLTNFRARAGAKRRGPCFASIAQPPIRLTCPAPATSSGDRMLVEAFDGLLLVGGKLHVKAYTYASGPKPTGFYELSIAIAGGRASGFVRKVSQVYGGNSEPVNCDSGKRAFTAVRS
jgi:hypothetical protein